MKRVNCIIGNSPINRRLFTQTSLPVCLAIGSKFKKNK